MKKGNIYYYDEDDVVPIKRKKKAPSKNNTPSEKNENINFTPRRSSNTVFSAANVSKTKVAETKNTTTKTAVIKTADFISADVHADEVKIEEVYKRNNISVDNKTAFAVSRTDDKQENGRKTTVVAEIPYNREYGRIKKAETPSSSDASEKVGISNYGSKKEKPEKLCENIKNPDVAASTEASFQEKKKNGFKIPFIIYTVVLLILSALALLYVRGLLLDYEASQPENIVQSKIDEMRKAAEKGKIGSAVSLAEVMEKFSPTDEDLDKFMADLLDSEVTYKKVTGSSDPDFIAFDILSDKYKMAHLEMRSKGKKAKLVIFTMDQWEIEEFELTGFTMDVTLPASLTVKNGEAVIEGVPTEDGRTATYSVSSLTMPNITFTDVLGNTKSYSDSGEYKFKEYLISIPSNYTLKGNDVIPLSAATLTDIDGYKYVSEYCAEMPKTATYSICIMSDEAELKVFDNKDSEVDISALGNSFEIEDQAGYDAMPENIKNAPDPLEIAKQWSLFMTDDLGGKTHGFYNMEKNLIADSYLRNVAWEWATGVDITFTSPHTLAKNPFTTAEVSNFVSYSDTCFSCDILLEKPMYITRANTVIDKIYSTFYFVYCDDTDNGRDNPHWAIADIQKIAE